MKLIKLLAILLTLTTVFESCYIVISRRMSSWMERNSNYLIRQSGFPDKIYHEYDSTQQDSITILIYKKNRIKKFDPMFKSKTTKQELDSLNHLILDSSMIREIYGERPSELLKEWRTYEFGFNSEQKIILTGYTGL